MASSSFKNQPIDSKQLAYFRHYLKKYFNEKFIYGLGTEEILSVIKKYDPEGIWLDVGSGTSTLFWALALTRIQSISCSDKYPEALKVLSEFIDSGRTPACYIEALNMLGKTKNHLKDLRNRFDSFYVFDAFGTWPDDLAFTDYDMISEFGTFGLAPNEDVFINCFAEPTRHLKKGGFFIGANWTRNPITTEKDGFDNSYLNANIVAVASKKYKLKIRELEMINIPDPEYCSVIIFVLQK